MLGLQEIRVPAPAPTTPSEPKKRKMKASSAADFADVVENILPDYDTVCELKINACRRRCRHSHGAVVPAATTARFHDV